MTSLLPYVSYAHALYTRDGECEASRYGRKEEDVDHIEGTTTMRDFRGD
jgi:hypothetical protein